MPTQLAFPWGSEVESSPEEEVKECSCCSNEYEESHLENLDCGCECCVDCRHSCDCCSRTECSDCTTLSECDECHNFACEGCRSSCRECGSTRCNDCGMSECSDCGRNYCSDCMRCCDDCGEATCSNCLIYSEHDDGCYCNGCIDSHRHAEYDPEYYDQDPSILEYEIKPDFEFCSSEFDKNNTMFFGVELECSFPRSNEYEVLRTAIKAFPGSCVWKHDGSIHGHGAELVTAPHTREALRKRDIKAMMEAFQSLGVRSGCDEGCGMHVHVSRRALKGKTKKAEQITIRRIQHFLSINKDHIITISGREDVQHMDRYAHIPNPGRENEWNYSRFVAFNNENRETVEFRLFAGVVNPEAFRANVAFSEATIRFCQDHGIGHCKRKESWNTFVKYCDKHYPHLARYMKGMYHCP